MEQGDFDMEQENSPKAEMDVTENTPKPAVSEDVMKKLQDLPPYMLESIKGRLDTLPPEVLTALAERKPFSREEKLRWKLPFNRHEMRKIAMECIYQYLLLGKDMKKILFQALKGSNQVDAYLYSLTIGTAENADTYKQQISGMLRKDWEFDRLSLLEQAILLMAFQEIEENGTEKPVVINEAVTMAKEYCDDQAYKLINGVLDQL